MSWIIQGFLWSMRCWWYTLTFQWWKAWKVWRYDWPYEAPPKVYE